MVPAAPLNDAGIVGAAMATSGGFRAGYVRRDRNRQLVRYVPPDVSKSNRARQQRARERIAQIRAEEARRRRRLWLAGGTAVVVAIGLVVGLVLALSGGGAKAASPLHLKPLGSLGPLGPAPAAGPLGPEQVPVPSAAALASTATAVTGQAKDGISCQSSEQTLFHIHAHLTVFVNGSARQVPAAIGIPGAVAQSTPRARSSPEGTCFYWLHTHAADGIIHIESPVQRTFTLGDFFDEWGQPLSASQVGPGPRHVVAIYNGQVFQGDPRDIPSTRTPSSSLRWEPRWSLPEKITFPAGLWPPLADGVAGVAQGGLHRPIRSAPKWNTLAASTASAPASTAGAKSASLPAPPLAITGTSTTARTARINARSKPPLVPSASIEFSRISPAPSSAARRAHSIASIPVPRRPPCVVTSKPLGAGHPPGVDRQHEHWDPNRSAISVITSGRAIAAVLSETLSAPARSSPSTSATPRTPRRR